MPEESPQDGPRDTSRRESANGAGDRASGERVWPCFRPIAPIVVGFALGLLLVIALPKEGWRSIASSFFMLLFSLMAWALDTALGHGVQLHCGGGRPLDRRARLRYAFCGVLVLALTIVAVLALANEWVVFYFGVVLVIAAVFVGEVGWGDPMWLVFAFFRVAAARFQRRER